jgi:hypothetical protein
MLAYRPEAVIQLDLLDFPEADNSEVPPQLNPEDQPRDRPEEHETGYADRDPPRPQSRPRVFGRGWLDRGGVDERECLDLACFQESIVPHKRTPLVRICTGPAELRIAREIVPKHNRPITD